MVTNFGVASISTFYQDHLQPYICFIRILYSFASCVLFHFYRNIDMDMDFQRGCLVTVFTISLWKHWNFISFMWYFDGQFSGSCTNILVHYFCFLFFLLRIHFARYNFLLVFICHFLPPSLGMAYVAYTMPYHYAILFFLLMPDWYAKDNIFQSDA